MGRPTDFTSELADAICERLSQGEPLAQICRDDGMPHPSTFRDWCDRGLMLDSGITLAIAYACAREDGFDQIALDALRIADTPKEGVRTTTDEDGEVKEVREDMLGHRKLQVETRLKLLAKWNPKRYGDKLTLGGDDETPLRVIVNKPGA